MLLQNPILRGFNPDPCFASAHGKYYLATSTFQWLPGVTLYESDDLAHWRCVGGALHDLDLRGIPESAGVWAPDLTFDEESGLFWLVYTVCRQIDGIFKDVSNYVVTAPSIEGPWSEPVFINAGGFDPGVFHEGGRHYVLNPQWDPRPLPGHHKFNGLVLQEFSLDQGLVGEPRVVLGNADAVNWLREGPHIMKRDGWYYIACAEGGTGRRHRIRMARSRELWGPYEVCSEPLVCAWCEQTPIRRAGHGNFVQAADGSWYVCHLCSRYLPSEDGFALVFDEGESGVSPLGRETAIQRVEWVDGWPRLAAGGVAPQVEVEVTGAIGHADDALAPGSSGYVYRTAFASDAGLWRDGWLMPHHIDAEHVRCGENGLELRGGDSPCSLFDRAALARRVASHDWRAEAVFSFEPEHYNQTAGLLLEYDARAFRYFSITWDEKRGCRVIDVLANDNGAFSMPLGTDARIEVPSEAELVHLGIEVHGANMRFSYAFDGCEPSVVLSAVGEPLVLDASQLSDERIEGWAYTGQMVGVTCVDMWNHAAYARVSSFVYEDLPVDSDGR